MGGVSVPGVIAFRFAAEFGADMFCAALFGEFDLALPFRCAFELLFGFGAVAMGAADAKRV